MTTLENVELADSVAKHVRLFPEAHDQNSWATSLPALTPKGAAELVSAEQEKGLCGSTTGCLAGWMMAFSGYKLKQALDGSTLVLRPGGNETEWESWEDEQFIVTAARLVGMDKDEAASLFYEMDNDVAIDTLEVLINEARIRREDMEKDAAD